MSYLRVNERCNGCLACEQNCPARAIDHRDEGSRRIILHSMTRCARCATCWRVCPQDAIEFRHLLEGGWDEVVTLEVVRCEVCGTPVHTARLGETLDPTHADPARPLCADHRARERAATAARLGMHKSLGKES